MAPSVSQLQPSLRRLQEETQPRLYLHLQPDAVQEQLSLLTAVYTLLSLTIILHSATVFNQQEENSLAAVSVINNHQDTDQTKTLNKEKICV